MDEHTAALIIVGDEILRGEVNDLNTPYLAKRLTAVGIRLLKVTVVPDLVNNIAEEVQLASRKYSIVFTAGGVGPTHDDVTYSAVAEALGLNLEESTELLDVYAALFPGHTEAKRLAKVPHPCEIVYVTCSATTNVSVTKTYPVIKVANVYVLPGSPLHFSQAVDAIVPKLEGGTPPHVNYFDINLHELSFVDILDEFAKLWEGQVNFGSYPQPGTRVTTRITIEGSREAVETARKDLRIAVMSRELNFSELFTLSHAQAVMNSCENNPHVRKALDVIERCYNEYADGIFMNFNGGKDCTAVLHLLATVAKFRGASPLLCLYVSDDPFPEVESFVKNAENYYGLEVIRKTGSIISALESLLEERNNLTTAIMGMRRGDPGADKLESFTATDEGWPAMVRVNPILDWTYNEVWKFLLDHKVPYCSLYDEGYTSLGKKTTTKKNPLLKDANNPSKYLPAYTLTDGSVERQGRG